MTISIRAARSADLPGVYDVLDAAFGAPLQLFVDQTEGDSTMRWRHIRVASDDSRILAHVRIFARTMMIRGVPVPAGGIGSVAAHPDARGLGLPSALLMDAADVMHRGSMPIGFLYTGIPAFYERLGWRVVAQPGFSVDPREVARIPRDGTVTIREITDADVPALAALHRAAIAATTGAIRRTARTWRDAQAWLPENAAGCLLAERAGRIVAYIRVRTREFGFQVLDGEHRPGEHAAMASLLAESAKRTRSRGRSHAAPVPADHAIATAYRTLPSTIESAGVGHPMMMRVVSLDALVTRLLPGIAARAATHRGPAVRLGLSAPDGERVTLDIRPAGARMTRARPDYTLDEAATLAALVGQSRTSDLARPRPPAATRRRLEALLPETPLHFWNADRI